ncbi:histidine phosphatase family protein [Leifsonia sp. McL0607]|uniref:histidine phosphatase family protein n=1 Tax=Leifsonia sp. McL0607 TaxID=3415672 RepID=UPI003CE69EC3
MTGRLLLIRHGESTANVAAAAAEAGGAEAIAVEARDADVPLSGLGERQAATLAQALRDHAVSDAHVFSSPYRRAVQTAQAADAEKPVLVLDERLRDRELGIIDALTVLGVERRLPLEAERRRWLGKFYYRPPGGESWADVALRVRSFLRDLPAGEGTAVIFTHDAVVSVFLFVLLGMTEDELHEFLRTRPVTNASVTVLARSDDGWRVDAFADASHLTEVGLPATEHPGNARADV